MNNSLSSITSNDDDLLLFDDYFSNPNAPGVMMSVFHNGRNIKFKARRSLSLGERQVASDASIKIEIDELGKPVLTKMDQAAFTHEILLMSLKWWPFRYPKDYEIAELAGQPVPINVETIAALDQALSDKMVVRILGMGDQQDKAIIPFVRVSGAASGQSPQETAGSTSTASASDGHATKS